MQSRALGWEEDQTVRRGSEFSLGVQAGDTTSSDAVRPHCIQLRKLFSRLEAASYSRDVVKFAPVLRIDGSIWHWDREGVGNVRVSQKHATATADIFVPIAIWKSEDESKLKQYLAAQIAVAYDLMTERISSKKLDCDRPKLLEDVAKLLEEFLE